MNCEELLEIYYENTKGAKMSTRILALPDLILSLIKFNIDIDEVVIGKIMPNVGKNPELLKWVSDYVIHFVSEIQADRPLENTESSVGDLDSLSLEDFASASDTPDDMEFLATLGVTNPERPWEK